MIRIAVEQNVNRTRLIDRVVSAVFLAAEAIFSYVNLTILRQGNCCVGIPAINPTVTADKSHAGRLRSNMTENLKVAKPPPESRRSGLAEMWLNFRPAKPIRERSWSLSSACGQHAGEEQMSDHVSHVKGLVSLW